MEERWTFTGIYPGQYRRVSECVESSDSRRKGQRTAEKSRPHLTLHNTCYRTLHMGRNAALGFSRSGRLRDQHNSWVKQGARDAGGDGDQFPLALEDFDQACL